MKTAAALIVLFLAAGAGLAQDRHGRRHRAPHERVTRPSPPHPPRAFPRPQDRGYYQYRAPAYGHRPQYGRPTWHVPPHAYPSYGYRPGWHGGFPHRGSYGPYWVYSSPYFYYYYRCR